MTYDPSVPNASISTGLFPTQNNQNFTRLKTIINADHVFNDTAQSTDGFHKEVTMIVRTAPGALPTGSNAILYVKVDASARSQLWYYNGFVDVQLTSEVPQEIGPIRVVGTATVTSGNTAVAYANPGFTWAGTGYAMLTNQSISGFWNLLRVGTNDFHEIDDTGGGTRPLFEFDGSNNLLIRNATGATRSLTWSLIINRIS